jgi:hypothetical protein
MRPIWGKQLALVVAAGLVCACTNESEPEPPPTSRETTTTSSPEERADLAGLEAAGIEARRIEPELGEDERFETDPLLLTKTIAVADGLLGWVHTPGGSQHLERSADLGASWRPVELPLAPDGLRSHQMFEVGDRVVVAASTSESWTGSDGYIWTSDDGTSWRGGPVPAAPPDATLTGPFTQLPDGRLAFGIYQPDQPQAPVRALVSDDGASWQPIGCPPGWTDSDCTPPPVFDGLWLRGTEVSLDEGATWQPIVVTPTTGDAESSPDQIQTAVATPMGGWLGLGYRSEVGLNKLWSVTRSDDGVVWETVLSDRCGRPGSEGVEAFYDEPVPLGDGWLVTHTCFHAWRPQRSELYLLDQAGSNPRLVATTESPGLYFARPVAVDDAVVVAELGITGTATFLQLRP